ncbi:MAG: RimK family alpha-L-glutamate ligase [Aestuariivirgaceae bacterium]|jgi:tetrahydromethanopterin:alpha-L-glutamate ligase
MPPSGERALRLVEAGTGPPRIAIFSEARDWHARRIARHLTVMGAEPRLVHLARCQFTSAAPSGIAIPGFGRNLPDACLVRSVPGGTFEAVTRRLGILHALRELGVVVWNDARVIERCVDKSTTTFLMQRAGIAVPKTWTVETRDRAVAIARRELRRGPLVLKPLFGSQGRGLRLLTRLDELPEPDQVDGVYYLQRFMGVEGETGFYDFRIFVVNGRPVAGMTRRGTGWITNVKQGGTPEPLGRDRQLEELSVRAANAVGADFCGVDLLRGANGATVVLEVNSMPAWSGLQKVSAVDIAELLARGILGALQDRRAMRVPL